MWIIDMLLADTAICKCQASSPFVHLLLTVRGYVCRPAQMGQHSAAKKVKTSAKCFVLAT